MRINHNIAALNTNRQLGVNNAQTAKNLEKLSSGLKINKAGDDAAGLAISEKMRGQIRGLDMAQKNAQDGISLIQTAEGALNETHAILQRMRELTVQAGNTGTQQEEDLTAIQSELNSLKEELGGMTGESKGISDRTQFNGKNLLDGTFGKTGTLGSGGIDNIIASENLTFQIGANSGQQLNININNMSARGLNVHEINVLGTEATEDTPAVDPNPDIPDDTGTELIPGTLAQPFSFDNEIDKIDKAIGTVSSQRSSLGAVQNRLEHTINNLGTSSENLTAAESRIRDVDMAKEMMEFTKNNILTQAAQSMLAQANQQPQGVLQLLR